MDRYFFSPREKFLSVFLSLSFCFSARGAYAQNSTTPNSPPNSSQPVAVSASSESGDGSGVKVIAHPIVIAFTIVTGIVAIMGFGVAAYQLITRTACPLNKASTDKAGMLSIVKTWLFRKVNPGPTVEDFINAVFERGDNFQILAENKRFCCTDRTSFAGVVLTDRESGAHVNFLNVPRYNWWGHRIDASHRLTRLDSHPEARAVGTSTLRTQVGYTQALSQAQLQQYRTQISEGLLPYVDLFNQHAAGSSSWTAHFSSDWSRMLIRFDNTRRGILVYSRSPVRPAETAVQMPSFFPQQFPQMPPPASAYPYSSYLQAPQYQYQYVLPDDQFGGAGIVLPPIGAFGSTHPAAGVAGWFDL